MGMILGPLKVLLKN